MLATERVLPAIAAVVWGGLVTHGAALAQERLDPGGGIGVGDLVRPTPTPSVGDRSAARAPVRGQPDLIVDPGLGVGASVRIEASPAGIVRLGRAPRSETDIVDQGLGVGATVRLGERGEQRIVFPGVGVGASAPSRDQAIAVGSGGEGTSIVIVSPNVVPRGEPGQRSSSAATSREEPSRSFPIGPSEGVSPMGFKDLDNGLRDCDIAFEDIPARSPLCRLPGRDPDQRCERFSFNQFPEVVKVITVLVNGGPHQCTGTMVSADWALTAAHCFLGNDAAAVENRRMQRPVDADIEWTPGVKSSYFTDVVIEANNAKMIADPWRRLRRVSRVVVHGSYAGKYNASPFKDDLALVKIEEAFARSEVEPATLTKVADPIATLAGFGYSNANGGTFGRFGVTWPSIMTRDPGTMTFKPSPESKGAFCQGDSGGPVYVGRHRGCKAYDIVPEARPRPLQGVISFNHLGSGAGATLEQWKSAQCLNARSMVVQDVTTDDRRRWICETTVNAVGGCER